jgi:hypothetical protein
MTAEAADVLEWGGSESPLSIIAAWQQRWLMF